MPVIISFLFILFIAGWLYLRTKIARKMISMWADNYKLYIVDVQYTPTARVHSFIYTPFQYLIYTVIVLDEEAIKNKYVIGVGDYFLGFLAPSLKVEKKIDIFDDS